MTALRYAENIQIQRGISKMGKYKWLMTDKEKEEEVYTRIKRAATTMYKQEEENKLLGKAFISLAETLE